MTAATSNFVATYGVPRFLYEYFNLLGTNPYATLDSTNGGLAASFGMDFGAQTRLSRGVVQNQVPTASLQRIRSALAAYFASDTSLGSAQRLFLEWNFLAPGSYAFVQSNGLGSTAVGWNREYTAPAGNNWTLYTFGLVECTAVIAYTPDGVGYLSHYDTAPYNPTQVAELGTFLKSHPDATVVAIGVFALSAANAIAALPTPPKRIYTMVKNTLLTEAYSVRVSRQGTQTAIDYNTQQLDAFYVPSIDDFGGSYGDWFAYGLNGEIYPGADSQYRPATLSSYPPSLAGSWVDNIGRSISISQTGTSLEFGYSGGVTYSGVFSPPNLVEFYSNGGGSVNTSGRLNAAQNAITFSDGITLARVAPSTASSISGNWVDNYGNQVAISQAGPMVSFTYNGTTSYSGASVAAGQLLFFPGANGSLLTLGTLNVRGNAILWDSGAVFTIPGAPPPDISGNWISVYDGIPVTVQQSGSGITFGILGTNYPGSFVNPTTISAFGIEGQLNASQNVITWSNGYVYTLGSPNSLSP